MVTIDGIVYLTAQASAELLEISRATFYKLRQQEKVKPEPHFHEYQLVGKGHTVFFKKEEIEAFRKSFVRVIG